MECVRLDYTGPFPVRSTPAGRCLARGFYLQVGHPMFLSLAHTEQDIEDTILAVRNSVAEVT